MALLKATSSYGGWFERSSVVIALVTMSAGRWNWLRTCSASASVYVETLFSKTIVGEGTTMICSSAMSVVEPGGGSRAAVAWGVLTGLASVTREAWTEEYGREAMTPESREAWLPSGLIEGVDRATESFLGLFFFSCSTVEGCGWAEEDSVFTSKGIGEANDEALGDGSKRSYEGSDPNQTPEEDKADSSDMFSEKKQNDEVRILWSKHPT